MVDAPDSIIPANYPGLASLSWNRDVTMPVAGHDALAIYEANWEYLDTESLDADEREMIQALAVRFGSGILAHGRGWCDAAAEASVFVTGGSDMSGYRLPQHRSIDLLLSGLNRELLGRCGCYFGGGTAIVLELGEYRVSNDVDFMCSDDDGYRELRALVVNAGFAALFDSVEVKELRERRASAYKLFGSLSVDGTPIKFEIVKEHRIRLDAGRSGFPGPIRLSASDQVAEKLMANTDRGTTKSEMFRDAIDLGMIVARRGVFPGSAIRKAEGEYGTEIHRRLEKVVGMLRDPEMRLYASRGLSMELPLVTEAVKALAGETRRAWPGALSTGPAIPELPNETHFPSLSMDGMTVRVLKRPVPGGGPARLDNPLGPAMVHRDRAVYALDGKCLSETDWLQERYTSPKPAPDLKA